MLNSIAITLILGIGKCSIDGDWCPKNPAQIAIEQNIINSGKHSLAVNLQHMSNKGDGEFQGKGDRGLETLMLQYKFEFGPKTLFLNK